MVIGIEQAKEGMILAEDIVGDNNIKILAEKTPLTKPMITQLSNKGYNILNVALTEEEMKKWNITEDFVPPTIDQKTIDSTKDILKLLYSSSGNKKINNESVKKIVHAAQIITSKILVADEQYIYYLSDYAKNKDSISKSVRVAAYATLLAKAYNSEIADVNETPQIPLEEIAIAGLLHNFGEICRDENNRKRLNFYNPLSGNFPGLDIGKIKKLKAEYDPEFVPYYSYNLLYDRRDISTFVKTVVIFSRETENDKGPLRAKQFTSPVYKKLLAVNAAKIISLCRMFDDILTTNIDKNETLENTQAALGALFKVNYYNEELIKLLIKNIPLYPIGTKVEVKGIHNGPAVVVDNYTDIDTWHRPSVRLLETGQVIDLRVENATVVNRLIENIAEVEKVLDNMDDALEKEKVIEKVEKSIEIERAIAEQEQQNEEQKPVIQPVVSVEKAAQISLEPIEEAPLQIHVEEPIKPVVVEPVNKEITPTVVEPITKAPTVSPIAEVPVVDAPTNEGIAPAPKPTYEQPAITMTNEKIIYPEAGNTINQVNDDSISLTSGPADMFGASNYEEELPEAVGFRM